MQIRVIQTLSEISSQTWDLLTPNNYPFTKHAYLYGLEHNDCLIPFGWSPYYFLIEKDNQLLAAIACYIKSNSYGELVFDHAWADAYQRSGLAYYPKLVTAIPYTPATGPRFLFYPDVENSNFLQQQLVNHIKEFCQQLNISSWHLLFNQQSSIDLLSNNDFISRYDCQFHWRNNNYKTFDCFLSELSSRKRKNIKKERKVLTLNQLSVKQRKASELSKEELIQAHKLYASIFYRKHGTATLTENFFISLGKNLGDHTLLFSAHNKHAEMIAISLLFVSNDTLYGRVWGCSEDYDHLHFELCYYQGIEYCIKNGLSSFDPGAQGEHKISRGFLPSKTVSAHWIKHPQFRTLIKRFSDHEKKMMEEYCDELMQRSPFKDSSSSATSSSARGRI